MAQLFYSSPDSFFKNRAHETMNYNYSTHGYGWYDETVVRNGPHLDPLRHAW